MLLVLVLLPLEPALRVTVLNTSLVDELITASRVLNSVLPLQIKLMALLMQTFEFFCGLVKLNLGGLSLSDLLLKLVGLAGHLDSEFFDLECQLLDFGLVCTTILLKGEVVFLLLAGSERPLLQLLLVPVHLQLELVHLLVGLEDHVLDVVQAILLVSDAVVKLFDFIFKAARLSLGDLLHVLLCLDLFVLGINEGLGVNKLHLDGLEML